MTKGFLDWLEENVEDQLGLHGKVIPVNTDHFEGHAHISFERVKRGKHQQHQYRVDYKGKGGHPKHGGKIHDHESMSFMDVDHDHGRPYKYRDHPHSSKDLHTLIHKAAPRWVSVEDLKPRPANEEVELQERNKENKVKKNLHALKVGYARSNYALFPQKPDRRGGLSAGIVHRFEHDGDPDYNKTADHLKRDGRFALQRGLRKARKLVTNEALSEAVDEDAVHKVLHHHASSHRMRYVDKAGNKFHGISVNDMPAALRDHGYHRVSRDHGDSYDLERAGFKIRHGAYDQGAKPTGKHVAVVHAFDHGSPKHQEMLQKQHAHAKAQLAKTRPDDTFGKSIHTSAMRSASDAHKKLFGKEL